MTESDPETGLDSAAARAKTDALAKRINRITQNRDGAEAARKMRQEEMTGFNKGFRLATELVAAIIVGALLGLAIDSLVGTSPIFLIVLLMFGFVAGVRNTVRAAAEMNAAAPQPDPATLAPVQDLDDDD